jgi:predicted nucleic acid-binding protein
MILVDTSVWVEHLRRREPVLEAALNASEVLMHPFILGELACGNLKRRAEVLSLMGELPQAPVVTEDEALDFIERRKLMGRGVGYVDVHLLASAVLTGSATVWTRDKRLASLADDLGRAFIAH